MQCDMNIRPQLMNFQMQMDRRRDRPFAIHNLTRSVNADHIAGTNLLPEQLKWIGKHGSVFLSIRDVARDVILIALARQNPAQQSEFRRGAQIRHKMAWFCFHGIILSNMSFFVNASFRRRYTAI
jgi:hypothetical protein